MARKRYTDEQRERLINVIDRKRDKEAKTDAEFNQTYRKSFVFISCWCARSLYFIVFGCVSFYGNDVVSSRSEIVLHQHSETTTSASRHSNRTITNLYLITNVDDYIAELTGVRFPQLRDNDTIQVERNIFGKAVSFTKPQWQFRYGINNYFQVYFIILFLTLISLFFNDGTDPFTNKTIIAASIADLAAMAYYFLS